jgi:hypothetical protein
MVYVVLSLHKIKFRDLRMPIFLAVREDILQPFYKTVDSQREMWQVKQEIGIQYFTRFCVTDWALI